MNDGVMERGYSDEQWKAACVNAGIEKNTPRWNRNYARYIDELPPRGDPATVLAMLDFVIRDSEDGERAGDQEFHGPKCLKFLELLDEVRWNGMSIATAIVLACAALPKEG